MRRAIPKTLTAALLLLPGPAFAGVATAASAADGVVTSSKSLTAFGRCFVGEQARAAKAWSFVPNAEGGTFSNLNGPGTADTYFLQVLQLSNPARISLQLEANTSASGAVRAAIERCA